MEQPCCRKKIAVRLNGAKRVRVDLQQLPRIRVGFCGVRIVPVPTAGLDIEHYAGAYDVMPLVTAQVLATRDRLMDDNVRVNMIPTREESNAAGGVTFIVG